MNILFFIIGFIMFVIGLNLLFAQDYAIALVLLILGAGVMMGAAK